jgi:hypothetical protein
MQSRRVRPATQFRCQYPPSQAIEYGQQGSLSSRAQRLRRTAGTYRFVARTALARGRAAIQLDGICNRAEPMGSNTPLASPTQPGVEPVLANNFSKIEDFNLAEGRHGRREGAPGGELGVRGLMRPTMRATLKSRTQPRSVLHSVPSTTRRTAVISQHDKRLVKRRRRKKVDVVAWDATSPRNLQRNHPDEKPMANRRDEGGELIRTQISGGRVGPGPKPPQATAERANPEATRPLPNHKKAERRVSRETATFSPAARRCARIIVLSFVCRASHAPPRSTGRLLKKDETIESATICGGRCAFYDTLSGARTAWNEVFQQSASRWGRPTSARRRGGQEWRDNRPFLVRHQTQADSQPPSKKVGFESHRSASEEPLWSKRDAANPNRPLPILISSSSLVHARPSVTEGTDLGLTGRPK